MKRIVSIAALTVACALAIAHANSTPDQGETTHSGEDPELDAAFLARRALPEFAQRAAELNEAAEALQAAIESLPEIRAIDAELASLRQRTRELVRLRDRVIEQYAGSIAPLRRDLEMAEQALLDSDPVRQVIDSRRFPAAVELEEPAR